MRQRIARRHATSPPFCAIASGWSTRSTSDSTRFEEAELELDCDDDEKRPDEPLKFGAARTSRGAGMFAYVLAAMAASLPQPLFDDVYAHPEQYEGALIHLCGDDRRNGRNAIVSKRGGRAAPEIRVQGLPPEAGCATGRLQRDPTDDPRVTITDYGGLRQWVFESVLLPPTDL
jgi:hypothetical protein